MPSSDSTQSERACRGCGARGPVLTQEDHEVVCDRADVVVRWLRTPEEEAIAQMRASDPEGWTPATDEQIRKLMKTQWMALGIALDRLGIAFRDSLPRRMRRWFGG